MATTATTARKTAATKRSTTAKKAAATRSRQPGRHGAQALHGRQEGRRDPRRELPKTPRRRAIAEYAERAVLVPVGAALVARDAVTEVVDSLRTR